jgi:hypothetical protein
MPHAQAPTNEESGLVHFIPVAPSKLEVVGIHDVHMTKTNWSPLRQPRADLIGINLSTFNNGPAAQKKLADQLYTAMTTQGFFVLTGFGISEEEIQRQVDIGYVSGRTASLGLFGADKSHQTVIETTPLEEKKALAGHMDTDGLYRGFKLRQYYEWVEA